MRIKNSGNIKLASLLFILGSSSAVLLIPAVVQKETISSATGSVIGKSNNSITDSLVAKAESLKKDYIETPANKVSETTSEVSKYLKEPQKIISSQEEQNNFQQNQILSSQSNNSTKPEAIIKITKQMVENCKLITDEFNKASK